MILRPDMAVAVARFAYAAQSVVFISYSLHAGLKSKKKRGFFTTPRCAYHGLFTNVFSVISATCFMDKEDRFMDKKDSLQWGGCRSFWLLSNEVF